MQAMRAARGTGATGMRSRQRSPAFEFSGVTTGSSAASLQQLFRQARASGSLNLTSRGLEEVPEQVFNLLGRVTNRGVRWRFCYDKCVHHLILVRLAVPYVRSYAYDIMESGGGIDTSTSTMPYPLLYG